MKFEPFIVEALKPTTTGWGNWVAPIPVIPEWHDDEKQKKLFGIELAKDHPSPFIAACAIFPDTSNALWASINWINDPVVVATRDIYLKVVADDTTLLDKDQFASKILKIADGRTADGRPVVPSDDLIKLLELYAKVRGFLKPENSISNNTTINQIKVTFVKAEERPTKTINNKNDNVIVAPIAKIKLV